MSGLSLEAADDARDEAQQGNLRDNDAGISDPNQVDYDNEGISDVKLHPNVLVEFDHIGRISINDYGFVDDSLLSLEQNMERAGPQNYGFDVQIALVDPEIVVGQLWSESDPDNAEYPDYKIVGNPESEDNPYDESENVIRDDDGNVTGAELDGINSLPGGNNFEGEPVPEGLEGYDYIEITIGASRATDVLGALDTAGRWSHNQDGELTEGLFEAPPMLGEDEYETDRHGAPRLIGYPELRGDMDGHRGAVSCTFDTDDRTEADTRTAVDVTFFTVDEDDEMETLVPLTPDDDAYALPTYPRSNNLYWDGDHDAGDDVGADAEPETSGGVADAQAAMQDDGGNSDGSTDYGDLSDDAQEFVDMATQALEQEGGESVSTFTEIGDGTPFDERVATDDGNINASADELAAIVEERRGGSS